MGDRLHTIARSIVEDAGGRNAVIVVGDLGGIHRDNGRRRDVNDKTHEMPFARLLNYIEYKTTRVWTCGCSTNTIRRRRATAVPARVSVRRKDGSSVPNANWTTTQTRAVR